MSLDIMLPYYGRLDHFREAVSSVLGQTDPDWRLVIIDDAYPDTRAFEWASGLDDPRVRVSRHDVNRGINRTFQECVTQSVADWVTIFGCDDVLGPDYVAWVKRTVAAHPEASMVHPSVRVIGADSAPVRSVVDAAKTWYRPHGSGTHVLSGEALAVSVLRGNWMTFPSVAWRGDAIRATGFRPGLFVVQDLALVLDLCGEGGALVLENSEPMFNYRRHAGSVSSWRAADGSRFTEERAFFTEVAARYRTRGWARAERTARLHMSSRVNAALTLPSALRAHDSAGIRVLADHVLGLGRGDLPHDDLAAGE